LECRELVLRAEGKQFDEKEEKDKFMPQPEKTGHIALEATLGKANESLLRYERAWKGDLYRAITTLKNLQMARQGKIRNKADKSFTVSSDTAFSKSN